MQLVWQRKAIPWTLTSLSITLTRPWTVQSVHFICCHLYNPKLTPIDMCKQTISILNRIRIYVGMHETINLQSSKQVHLQHSQNYYPKDET